jgi:hypothetical protein
MLRLRGVVLDRTLPLDASREFGGVLDLGMLLTGEVGENKTRESHVHLTLKGDPVIALFLVE